MVRLLRSIPIFFALGLLAAADAPPASYVIQTVAGSDFVGDGGPALAALLSQTEGIVVDRNGAIYVADADDSRIREITPDGVIQTVAGTGVAGFSGDSGPANAAMLNHPYGLALDLAGNLYVADLGNGRVRKILVDGTILTVAGGGSIAAGGNGDGSPALMMQLRQPRNLAIDPDGTLYISDFGANRVYSVSPAGILTTVAGNGNAGFSGDGASAQLAKLNAPAGIASDGRGALYIADSGNNRIRLCTNGAINTVYNLAAPTGLVLGNAGTLYVASAGYLGPTTKAIPGVLSALDLALDGLGNMYATMGQFVVKVATNGQVTTLAGSGAPRHFGGDHGPANLARLNAPSGITLDAAGNMYIADTGNQRIRKISTAGVITTVAGIGNPGSKGDNGLAVLAELNTPRGVAVDSKGNLYVADSGNNQIRKITPAGSISTPITGLNDPEAVVVDAADSLYIADTKNNRVLKLAAGVTTTLAQIQQPLALAVDPAGNVFAANSTQISSISPAGAATVALAGLSSPRGLAVTPQGDLLIADSGVNVIRRLAASGSLTTIAGTGAAGFAGDDGQAAAAQLNSPFGLAVDRTGVVWIADQVNDRIRTLTPIAGAAQVDTAPAIVNAASLAAGPIAPGEIVTVFGSGFDPIQTQLLFDGKPAAIFYLGGGQINALAPLTLTPGLVTQLSILVKGTKVADISVPVFAAVPGIFTTADGGGTAAANNQDGSANSISNPAARGSVVVLYATGAGSDVSSAVLTIGGIAANLLYAGPAPGFVGLIQINARVPASIAPGMQPVVMTIGNAASQVGVALVVF